MKIGLLSDTHNFLDPKLFQYLAPCDEVWHAGDIGNYELLESLQNFRPTTAVFGNIDSAEVRSATQEEVWMKREGKTIFMTHIAGKPPGYNKRIKEVTRSRKPDLLIAGHSHILKVEMDKKNNWLFMNPGAAGKHGFHKVKTLLRFDILDGTFQNLEVVELGPRAKG